MGPFAGRGRTLRRDGSPHAANNSEHKNQYDFLQCTSRAWLSDKSSSLDEWATISTAKLTITSTRLQSGSIRQRQDPEKGFALFNNPWPDASSSVDAE